MTIVKVGALYINADNITHVEPVNPQVTGEHGVIEVNFVGYSNEDYGSIWLTGSEAEYFLAWLDKRRAN